MSVLSSVEKGKKPVKDTFGMDDDDWTVYKEIVRFYIHQCGVVWCGVVGCGVVWCGVVWYAVVWGIVPPAPPLTVVVCGVTGFLPPL